MGYMKKFILGLILGVLIASCTSAPKFIYKYYALDAVSYEGHLRGPKPENDLLLNECLPTASDKTPCVVLKRDEFFKLKGEFVDSKDKLIQCQRGAD